VSYSKPETETVYSINQLRYEIEENQTGIGITDEDGPLNLLMAVHLRDARDFHEWMAICHTHPGTEQPSSYPAIVIWYTSSVRGSPIMDQQYMMLPLKDAPWFDSSRPEKATSDSEKLA
jgi:hypothetical protein